MAAINEAALRDLFSSFKGEHKSGINLLKKVIAMFDKSSVTGAEKRTQAKFAQSATSRGLAGSTVAPAISAGLSKEFEDIRVGRLSEAMNNLANFFASPGTIAHVATGGFRGDPEPTGAVIPGYNTGADPFGGSYVASGNQQGQGYQPPQNFGGTRSNFNSGPAGSRFRQGAASGSASGDGSAWGSTALGISQTQQDVNRRAPTVAGMEANYGILGETSLGPEPDWLRAGTTPDWAEAAEAEQAYQGGWTG